MIRNSRTALVAAVVILAASALPALAAVENYTIDPAHSQVGFKIRHIVSKVPGRFTKFSGTIDGDPANLATAKVSVEIEAASIDTDNEQRDKHLRSADFFDVEKFPKLTFASTEVVPKGPGKATLMGNLTLHGVTKPVEIDVDVLGFSPDPFGGYRGGFEGRTTINRKDFGIIWNKTLDAGGLLLGEDVEITLNVEAVRQQPKK